MMGYCTPVWISDYTFNALFQRIQVVNGADLLYPAADLDRVWERARVDMKGNLAWLPPVTLHTPPGGRSTQVTVQTAAGAPSRVGGQYFPYDHVPGGVLLWPAGSSAVTGIQATIEGRALALGARASTP
jgi:hypothetical protein